MSDLMPEREREIREGGWPKHHPINELLASLDAVRAECYSLKEENEKLRAEIENLTHDSFYWKATRFEAENDKLRAECAVARERLGPAGYRIVQEVSILRERVAALREGLRLCGHNGLLPGYTWDAEIDKDKEARISAARSALAQDDAKEKE